MKKRLKVAVGISGGVDSSVAAALLQRGGYDVVGVHLQCFSEDVPYCTATEDKEYAIRVAARLQFPLKIYDFRKEYGQKVIDLMVAEYAANRTPNPDIMCNREIKFGVLYEHVFEDLHVDYFATGHYAKLVRNEKSQGAKLCMARDKTKDQSYFLALLDQAQLAKALFPLGDLLKSEVRHLAHEFKLPTANKPDSQGLCFVGEVGMTEFLRERLKLVKGEVVTTKGEIVGSHEGLPLYTIGQRHGFELFHSTETPLFVVGKDVTHNRLVVGGKDQLMRNFFEVRVLNWIGGDTGSASRRIGVRIRHLGALHQCRIENSEFGIQGWGLGSEVSVFLEKPIEAVAPGQVAVFYEGDVVVGAGEIV